jgi:hypothetical protein
MAARCSKEELFALALAEIYPPEQKKAACRVSIDEALRLVDMTRVLDEAPGPGECKRKLETLADSLKKTKRALTQLHETTQNLVFRGLPEAVGPVDHDRFLKDVDRLILTCEFTIKHLQVSFGARRWNAAKYTCALQASILLKEFSPSRLSQTKEGHFSNLPLFFMQSPAGRKKKTSAPIAKTSTALSPFTSRKFPTCWGRSLSIPERHLTKAPDSRWAHT